MQRRRKNNFFYAAMSENTHIFALQKKIHDMIKNVVFDFGGVVVDIDRRRAVDAFVRLGLTDADTILDKYHQTGIFLELEEGTLSESDYRKRLGEMCKRTLEWEEVRRAWLAFITGMDERKLAFFEKLRSKYRLFVLSNTNPYIMSWACSSEFSSGKKPLNDYFDRLYLSYQIGYTKPDRRIFDYMLCDASLQPAETLFVDDGAANIEAGKKVGMHTLLVENGDDWREKVSAALGEKF